MTPLCKTIVLGMLEDMPALYSRLKAEGTAMLWLDGSLQLPPA